ncbi:MAG: hypothetical protein NTZ52_02015 [Chlamydiae bacterium]|nr:hypothetical protein [Chlamydiota bacterium]
MDVQATMNKAYEVGTCVAHAAVKNFNIALTSAGQVVSAMTPYVTSAYQKIAAIVEPIFMKMSQLVMSNKHTAIAFNVVKNNPVIAASITSFALGVAIMNAINPRRAAPTA